MTLRASIIRLASEKPELRPHLLPLLKEAGGRLFWVSGIARGVKWKAGFPTRAEAQDYKRRMDSDEAGMLRDEMNRNDQME